MMVSYELAEYLSVRKTISAPVSKVWSVFLDMNQWYTDYHWDWVSGPPYQGVGLQEGQVLKASPLYGAGLQDPTLFFFQEQVKVTPEAEIVVKITAADPASLSAEYATAVKDIVAFYHWEFIGARDSTTILVRSYCNLRTEKRPAESVLEDLTATFYRIWNKSLDKLETIVCDSSSRRTPNGAADAQSGPNH
jgi:hypothetical protein